MKWFHYTSKKEKFFIEYQLELDAKVVFCGVKPWDNIRSLESSFGLLFNDADDEFLLEREGGIQLGISFATDYRASLDRAPDQIIQHISIHDWSLR